MLKGKNVMRDIPRCVLTLPKSSVLKGPLRRTFAEGRSWQPGSSLADLPEDVVTVDRIEKRKVQNDIARSLVGGDVHGKHKPRLERWSGRALFRRGGLDRKFRSADEVRLSDDVTRKGEVWGKEGEGKEKGKEKGKVK